MDTNKQKETPKSHGMQAEPANFTLNGSDVSLIVKSRRRRRKSTPLLLICFIIWILVVLVAHWNLFYQYGPFWMNVQFAEGFWPNFISDLGATLFLALFLRNVLDETRQYKLQIDVILSTRDNGSRTATFYIFNDGQDSFLQPVKWHMYLKKDIVTTPPTPHESVDLKPLFYLHYQGEVTEPIYVGDKVILMENLTISSNPKSSNPAVYFYFSTELGLSPRNVKVDANGKAFRKSLDYLDL